AIQLNNSFGVEECYQAVNMIGADALVLHLNPLQEAIQQGGNTNFKHLLSQIQKVCSQLTFPVIVKETGCGMSKEVALKLKKAEVAGIDVSGAGGTSWAIVEAAITNDRIYQKIGNRFAEWGIPTAESLIMTRAVAPDLLLIASGGIRSGIDVAKAIALGADAVGLALPLLKPATESADMVAAIIRRILTELEIAMFCIGAENLRELKNTSFLE
ncbi:MAG: alpha-hydroxy-acid oxidizing protein, partial [Methanosarcinales archaeon]